MRADFSLDYDMLVVEQPQKLYLLARFEAGDAPGERTRRPLNLSLVIDRSGSMAGDKIDYTRQSAQFLVQHLTPRDRFSIVLYNDKVETLRPPESVVNKDQIVQLIEDIRVRGTTNLSGGWLEGCKHVEDHLDRESLNRVILMSDGLANRGVTDASMLLGYARQKREKGVSTTTMGLGRDFNEDLLIEMSSAGGGAFYFIESPEVAPEIFQEELTGLLNVVGQNLTITIAPDNLVTNVRQLNAYPESENDGQPRYVLGDIFGNEVKTLVIELTVPALERMGRREIATLRFEYDEITSEGTDHQVKTMPVMINVASKRTPATMPDREVARSVLLLKAAQARQDAVQAADRGEFETASQALQAVIEEIDAAQVDDDQLNEEREALKRQSKMMEQGASDYDNYGRKTIITQSYYSKTNRHNDTIRLRDREQRRQVKEGEIGLQGIRDTLEQEIASARSAQPVKRQGGVSPTHISYGDQTFALSQDIVRLGRSSHNELVIDARGVSRFHAQLRREGEQWILEDLGSTNGTVLNGSLLSEPKPLSAGDVFLLCDERILCHAPDDQTALDSSAPQSTESDPQ